MLIQTESGNPVLAERNFGKGRVIAFGYRNAGLSWHMPMAARGHFVDAYWEYFYALLCRSLIYAAGREPSPAVNWDTAKAEWRLKDSRGALEKSGTRRQATVCRISPPAGTSWSSRPRRTWNISVLDVAQPDKIENLEAASGRDCGRCRRWR